MARHWILLVRQSGFYNIICRHQSDGRKAAVDPDQREQVQSDLTVSILFFINDILIDLLLVCPLSSLKLDIFGYFAEINCWLLSFFFSLDFFFLFQTKSLQQYRLFQLCVIQPINKKKILCPLSRPEQPGYVLRLNGKHLFGTMGNRFPPVSGQVLIRLEFDMFMSLFMFHCGSWVSYQIPKYPHNQLTNWYWILKPALWNGPVLITSSYKYARWSTSEEKSSFKL